MPKRSSSSPMTSPRKRKALARKVEVNLDKNEEKEAKAKGKNHGNSIQNEDDMLDAEEATLERGGGDAEATALKLAFFEFFAGVTQIDVLENPEVVAQQAKELAGRLIDGDVSERRAVIDQLLRDFLLEKVVVERRSSWTDFLELGIILAKADICNPSILFTLLSDFFELGSMQECHRIFDFVEKHIDLWKLFLVPCKNAVLRMCNDLLRRLSRAQNTILCGRILIFLSNYLPFSERSGLNIMSEFNNDNITLYKTNDGMDDDPEDNMDIVDEDANRNEVLFEGMDISIPGLDSIVEQTVEEKKNKMKVDYNLYIKFWSLQDFFQKPHQCYNKVTWKSFTMYINDVLTVFSFFKIDEGTIPKNKKLKKRRSVAPVASTDRHHHDEDHHQLALSADSMASSDIPRLSDESHYFAKYLTNRRLLELQMNDPSFRRYFLVQLLIILQYLTVSVKFKGEGLTLTEDQQEYVKKTTERVYQLLEEIPPAGKQFVQAVRHVLQREQLWNQWKNDGCPPFPKPSVSSVIVAEAARLSKDDKMDASDEPGKGKGSKGRLDGDDDLSRSFEDSGKSAKKKKRRPLGSIVSDSTESGRFLMGNSELTRLWNICGDNLEACRSKTRDFTPPIDSFFTEAFKEVEMDPTPADPKKEVMSKEILGNSNFGWRALRLLARKSPYFFQMFGGAPVHPLQNYLEFVLRKILAEKDVPAQPATPEDKSLAPKEGLAEESQEDKKREEEQEAEMEGEAEEDEEMLNEARNESEEDEEEGEVNDKVRSLTDVEIKALGKNLSSTWKKLATRLGFTADEIQYFEDETKSDPGGTGAYMLRRWSEQDAEDATVADLLYTLEGLGLKELADGIF